MKRKYKIWSIVGGIIILLGIGIFFFETRDYRRYWDEYADHRGKNVRYWAVDGRGADDWRKNHRKRGSSRWGEQRHRYGKGEFENQQEYENFLKASSKEYSSFEPLLEATQKLLDEEGYTLKREVLNHDPNWAVLMAQKDGVFFSVNLEHFSESKSRIWVGFFESESFRRLRLNKNLAPYKDFFSKLDNHYQ